VPAAILFDAHVHIWEAGEETYPQDRSFGPPPELDAPLDQLLLFMDRSGVGRAALVQPGNYGFDAGLVADVIKRYPKVFVGLGMVDPRQPDVEAQIVYWMEERGLSGMRVLGSWLEAPYLPHLWRRIASYQGALSFLTGPVDLDPLARLLSRLPPTPVILDHFAHRKVDDPAHCRQLLDLASFPNVYVKMSGLYALSHQPHPHPDVYRLIQDVIQAFGVRRLMWASDYPYIREPCGYQPCLELFQHQLPQTTPEEREWICGRTAQSLWPI
jgi:predicted TIM-barrel fold metal-dependent hydrolase